MLKSDRHDVTIIVNGHREGLLAGPSISSMLEARAEAIRTGLSTEVVAVLDRSDDVTCEVFRQAGIEDLKIITTDYGDPGLARNRGAQEASGRYVTFLDADDLWGFNWISAAFRFADEHDQPIIAHSEVNVVFGEVNNIWVHADSASEGFDPTYLMVGNYWDAMSLTERRIMLEYPFVANNLKAGYGHEDWDFNNRTLLAGIQHRPVPNTVHFKRRRANSQMARCSQSDVVPWITDVYTCRAPERRANRGGNPEQLRT